MREYGSAWRRSGCFGVRILLRNRSSIFVLNLGSQVDRLMLTDPKAIKYILHSAGQHYPKTAEKTQLLKLIAGNGLGAVEGLQSFR